MVSTEAQLRKEEHSHITPVVNKARRLAAVGTTQDFPNDPMLTYLTRNAERLFEPKRILTDGDWLVSHREGD